MVTISRRLGEWGIDLNKYHNKTMLLFSSIFFVLIVLLLLVQSFFMETFYVSANKKMMMDYVDQYEIKVSKSGPKAAAEEMAEMVGIEFLILDTNLKPLGLDVKKRVDVVKIQEMIKEGNASFKAYEEVMLVTKQLKSGDIIVLSKPMGIAYEASHLYTTFITRASIVIYIIGLMIIYVFSRKLSDPIKKLSESTKYISELNFDETVVLSRKDELGDLSYHISSMAEQLKVSYNQLETELEQEKKLEKMRRLFVSNVSHELKNPLTIIQGYADGLNRGIPKSKESIDKYNEIIYNESRRMSVIINDLLDLSSYDAGVVKLVTEEVQVNTLVEDVFESYETQYREKNINVHMDIEVFKYNCDTTRMSQIFSNLISNACKYVDVGGEVTIRLSQSNGCVFTISNTGELLTKDECETIWTSFYQKDSTRIGSGLGLAIVKSLSELHGGHVRAYSDTMNHFEVKI